MVHCAWCMGGEGFLNEMNIHLLPIIPSLLTSDNKGLCIIVVNCEQTWQIGISKIANGANSSKWFKTYCFVVSNQKAKKKQK